MRLNQILKSVGISQWSTPQSFCKMNTSLMLSSKNKIKLAPRLRWGVGRDTNKINFFKIGGGIFLVLSAALIIRAGWLLFSGTDSPANNPQVLGEADNNSAEQLFTEHQVETGETLFSIAKDNGVDWTMLATINNLKAPFTLQVGQKLKIPKQ